MNQEIKQKLEQAAESVVMKLYYRKPSEGSSELNEFNEFKSVAISLAQTILDNPGDWGLVPKDEFDLAESNYDFFHVKCAEAEYQLTKYREALERVLQLLQACRPHTPGLGAPINIIKSVLEQEGKQ